MERGELKHLLGSIHLGSGSRRQLQSGELQVSIQPDSQPHPITLGPPAVYRPAPVGGLPSGVLVSSIARGRGVFSKVSKTGTQR